MLQHTRVLFTGPVTVIVLFFSKAPDNIQTSYKYRAGAYPR